MKCSVYSHCAGIEAVAKPLHDELLDAITSVQVRPRRGSSRRIRDAILQNLVERGWSKALAVSPGSGMTITSFKSRVGLCIQTGNVARMYADLLKLQKLYRDDAIQAAVMILPSLSMANAIGSNVAHTTRLHRELEIFRDVIDVPMLVLGLE